MCACWVNHAVCSFYSQLASDDLSPSGKLAKRLCATVNNRDFFYLIYSSLNTFESWKKKVSY